MRISRKASYLIYFLVVILSVLQIIISNRLSHFGKKISELTQKTNEISLENERIKKKIASSSSLTTLSFKAKELGLTKKTEVIYLDKLFPVAQKP